MHTYVEFLIRNSIVIKTKHILGQKRYYNINFKNLLNKNIIPIQEKSKHKI